MKFSSFLWENFLESKEGNRNKIFFSKLLEIFRSPEAYRKMGDFLDSFAIQTKTEEALQSYISEVLYLYDAMQSISISSREDAEALFVDIVNLVTPEEENQEVQEHLYDFSDIRHRYYFYGPVSEEAGLFFPLSL